MKDGARVGEQRPEALVILTFATLILGLITEMVLGLSELVAYGHLKSFTDYLDEVYALTAFGFLVGTGGSFFTMYVIGTVLKMKAKWALPVLLICLGAYFGVLAGRIVLYMIEGDSLSLLNGYLARVWPQVALIAIPAASAVAIASIGGTFLGLHRNQEISS